MVTTTNTALDLAHEVRVRCVARGGVDHLKLQKLCFYSYGAALGYGVADEVGDLTFEAWKHGPVHRDIWNEYKEHRGNPLPAPSGAAHRFESAQLTQVLDDIVEVYGRLSSWSIRCESHREEPWLRAIRFGTKLDADALTEHFQRKFRRRQVSLPQYLSGSMNADVDGLPRARFESLHDMAEALRERRQT